MSNEQEWLPIAFMLLMGFALLVYSLLDGYDLGIGLLLPADNEDQRDTMIASIGPFWDANETWLVLAVGLLLIAFPQAHGIIFSQLYLPVAFMLIGLIMRGVAFDFRTKSLANHKRFWEHCFKAGSLLSCWSQGYMLGSYVMGFEQSWAATGFSLLSAVCVSAAYSLIGACWLLIKTEGELQLRACQWARVCLWLCALGILAVSIVNPLVSERIASKWLAFPQIILLAPIPVLIFGLVLVVHFYLKHFPYEKEVGVWLPFAAVGSIFFLCFQALAYSFFPYIVPDRLTIWEAAAATESLQFIFYGTIFVLPAISAYTVFAYWVFRGKASKLSYH